MNEKASFVPILPVAPKEFPPWIHPELTEDQERFPEPSLTNAVPAPPWAFGRVMVYEVVADAVLRITLPDVEPASLSVPVLNVFVPVTVWTAARTMSPREDPAKTEAKIPAQSNMLRKISPWSPKLSILQRFVVGIC